MEKTVFGHNSDVEGSVFHHKLDVEEILFRHKQDVEETVFRHKLDLEESVSPLSRRGRYCILSPSRRGRVCVVMSKGVRIHSADEVSLPSVDVRRVTVEYQTSDDPSRIGRGGDFFLKAGRQPRMKHLLHSSERSILDPRSKNLLDSKQKKSFETIRLNHGGCPRLHSFGSKQTVMPLIKCGILI